MNLLKHGYQIPPKKRPKFFEEKKLKSFGSWLLLPSHWNKINSLILRSDQRWKKWPLISPIALDVEWLIDPPLGSKPLSLLFRYQFYVHVTKELFIPNFQHPFQRFMFLFKNKRLSTHTNRIDTSKMIRLRESTLSQPMVIESVMKRPKA